MSAWTATTIAPSSSLGSRAGTSLIRPSLPEAPSSSVGNVNALAQLPITADMLRTTPETLSDPALASRAYANPLQGLRTPVASASVYEQPNVPAFLQNAVSNLNAEQALRRSLQSEWANKIMMNAEGGGPNAYLWMEALRAASVNPGAHVSFGSSVQNPVIGQGYYDAAEAYKQRTSQQAKAVEAANKENQAAAPLPAFTGTRSYGGVGGYTPEYQAYLNRQAQFDIANASNRNSNVQQLGRYSASGSGWMPTLPTF